MKKLALIFATGIIVLMIAAVIIYARTQGIDVLEPQGIVAAQQRDLFVFASYLSLFVLIPTFLLTLYIVVRYRQRKTKDQTIGQTVSAESSIAWFALMVTVVGILAVVMLRSTQVLDPYRPIQSDKQALTVQVVAMQWKWLFIYPEQGLATVNELVIPENTPITFEITADAPMSSFWIPKLGGMIYAMEGMVTKLNLQASSTGTFDGHNAEINGKGYADMNFEVKSVSDEDFAQWVAVSQGVAPKLDGQSYADLAQPTVDHPVEQFAAVDKSVFGSIIAKFMDPNHHHSAPTTQAH